MILAYCVDTIYIIKWVGKTIYNEPIPSPAAIKVKGKIEYKITFITDLTGEDVVAGGVGGMVSGAMVRLPQSIDIALGRALISEDRLRFDSVTGVEHAILKIGKPKAFSGPIYEVYVA